VWDAQTHECLEVTQGEGAVAAIPVGPSEFPLRAFARGQETVVTQAKDGRPIAWFPVSLDHIVTHPFGRIWAGASGNQLCIISFEGVTEPARQEDITTP
jgi:hypothetical protein